MSSGTPLCGKSRCGHYQKDKKAHWEPNQWEVPIAWPHPHQWENMGAQPRAEARMLTLAVPKSVFITKLSPCDT